MGNNPTPLTGRACILDSKEAEHGIIPLLCEVTDTLILIVLLCVIHQMCQFYYDAIDALRTEHTRS